jgi:hypothetical protein
MRLTLDHNTNSVMIKRRVYSTDDLKTFLIEQYPALVTNCYVRAIQTPRGVRFTYDWIEIFTRCERTTLPLVDFINKQKLLKTGGLAIRS